MPQFYDTLLAEYIKRPGERGMGLDDIAKYQFSYDMIAYEEVTQKKTLNFEEVSLQKAAIYSAEDVYITKKIFDAQNAGTDYDLPNTRKIGEKEEGTSTLLEAIDIPVMQVLKNMEINGACIDGNVLSNIGEQLQQEIAKLSIEIQELSGGEECNINSPKQVGELLFEKLGLPTGKKTKTGWSVSAEVLENLAPEYPIAQKIVDYRHYSKIYSTYIVALSALLTTDPLKKDGEEKLRFGIVHTNYNQTIAATGRLSSINPNLQNIPSSSGLAGEIRRAFVSRFEGGSIMAFDYSQVELRLLALMSGDQNLLQAFQNGEDLHTKTAQFLFGDTTITSEQRKIAKAVNFGVIYGMSGFGLSKAIKVSVADGNTYIKRFYETYPQVKSYFETVITDCEKNGYVQTLFGRRRYIKGINDRNNVIKSAAQREATNMPIQGTNADIIKIAMIEVGRFLDGTHPLTPSLLRRGDKDTLKSKMILQVHDELVFDVYPGEEDLLEKEVTKIMEQVLSDAPIALKVDCNRGNNWKEAK